MKGPYKIAGIVLAIMMIVLCLAACSKQGPAVSGGSGGSGFTSSDSVYASYDLSQPLTIYLYMVGGTPNDIDEVMAKANEEYFKPILNTTVEIAFISWGDISTKYALVLAGGEDVDLVFTAPWNYYEQESNKGSFLELTEDFRAKWLPQTQKDMPLVAWLQMLTKGKIYAASQMVSQSDGYKFVVIRDDLRTKYGLPEPTDWDSLENYLFTVAAREPSIQAYAAAASTAEVFAVYNQYRDVQTADYTFAWDGKGRREPAADELTYYYLTDYYRDYALEMKEWFEKGVWSKNVMNNTVTAQDSFIQGKGGSVFWNTSVFEIGRSMEKNGVGAAGWYDLTADKPVRLAGYSNNAFGVASASKNPERAALVLDLMKTNLKLNTLLQGGVEGKHYLDLGDGTRDKGPSAEDYPWNGWAWALNHPDALKDAAKDSPQRWKDIQANIDGRTWEPLIDGFRFDSSSLTNEWAVISALVEEYSASFGCGVFGGDTLNKIEEFQGKLRAAGIDKITQEYRRQYADFVAKYGGK
ncbi:MAG: ABC transporter substrate-binding protein [Treponema sp.]|jgi:ABC-type glycerol-3-phosphate transport system substrate-binding protein|nr:ABC transporter substrate-binding protein [Treponema sp.]